MRNIKWIALFMTMALLLGCLAGCGGQDEVPKLSSLKADPDAYADEVYGFQLEKPAAGEEVAVMHTSMGDISIRFFPEAAPKAVANFKALARTGYYDGLTFHRVMNDFMIQGGDPSGDGTGGESVWGKAFSDEFSKKLMNLRGSLAMANSGVDTNGSQFFINQAGPTGDTAAELKAAVETSNQQMREQVSEAYSQYVSYYGSSFTDMYPTEEAFLNANLTPAADLVPEEAWELYAQYGGNIHLDGGFRYTGGHTVFGQVYEGMDVVDAIAAVETDDSDKPTTDVTINSIDIVTYGE